MTVFISYSHTDTAQARQVHAALKDANLDPRVDFVDGGLGASFLDYMDKTLAQAKCLVLLHSQASSQSYWAREEWLAALASRTILVVPMLLDDTPLPPLLSHRVYADGRRAFETALSELVERLRLEVTPIMPAIISGGTDEPPYLVNCTRSQLMAVALASITDEYVIKQFLFQAELDDIETQLTTRSVANKVIDLLCLLQKIDELARFANWLDTSPNPLGRLVRAAKRKILSPPPQPG